MSIEQENSTDKHDYESDQISYCLKQASNKSEYFFLNSARRREKLYRRRGNKIQTTYQIGPMLKRKPNPIYVTMKYYGKNVNLSYDSFVFAEKDHIQIYQQHCGGENLLVYSGYHVQNDKFTFKSERHKEYSFGITIYINGIYDSRISTCCEHKHTLNMKIGIRTGRFCITNVEGSSPCIKCSIQKAQSPTRPHLLSYSSMELNTPRSIRWNLICYFISNRENMNEPDSQIYLQIINGTLSSSSYKFLGDMVGNDRKFRPHVNKFSFTTKNFVPPPTHLTFIHKDPAKYYNVKIDKLVLINTNDNTTYTFSYGSKLVPPNTPIHIYLDETDSEKQSEVKPKEKSRLFKFFSCAIFKKCC